jgi:hypothetical protein
LLYGRIPFELVFTHPERRRDRPCETSATAIKLVPNPADSAGAEILEDEAGRKNATLSIQRGFLLSTGM